MREQTLWTSGVVRRASFIFSAKSRTLQFSRCSPTLGRRIIVDDDEADDDDDCSFADRLSNTSSTSDIARDCLSTGRRTRTNQHKLATIPTRRLCESAHILDSERALCSRAVAAPFFYQQSWNRTSSIIIQLVPSIRLPLALTKAAECRRNGDPNSFPFS